MTQCKCHPGMEDFLHEPDEHLYALFNRLELEANTPPVDHDLEAYRLQSDSLRHRMSKAIGLLSTIQASGVLEAHGHDDLNECLEEALGALVGRKE